jgi:hypothetical protein
MHRNSLIRSGLCLLNLAACLLLPASGCGSSDQGGPVATPAKEHARRNQEMLDYMKTQKPAK